MLVYNICFSLTYGVLDLSTSVQVTQIHSFLWLNNIPLYHNFFIHSSFYRHLGCFYVLAIVNSAAMNIGIHVSLNSLFFDKCFPTWTSHSLGSLHHTHLFLWLNVFWFLLISLTGAFLAPTIAIGHLLSTSTLWWYLLVR